MVENPFAVIDRRLSSIERLLLDIKKAPANGKAKNNLPDSGQRPVKKQGGKK